MAKERVILIVNPFSGKAKMKTELLGVVDILSEKYEVTVYPTKSRGDATVKVSEIEQDEYDLIVACGGDGTLNEVITGLMKSGVDCRIAYIPSGTLNEWSQGLGISRNICDAAKDILSAKETTLDIGKFADKYFSYTASFGAFTSASYSTPQEIKNVLGQAAYFFEGVKSLANIKPIHLKITTDKTVYEGDYLFGAVSNSMSVGGIVKFDGNQVALNDGLFEVLLIKKPDNILKIQGILDGILKKDLNREGMEFFHADKLVIEGEKGVSWTLDGEFAEADEITEITNINRAIRFLVP